MFLGCSFCSGCSSFLLHVFVGFFIVDGRSGNTYGPGITVNQDDHVFSGYSGSEETALGWAALEGHLDTALVLIEAGANVNAGNHGNWTPLMSAAYYGHPEMVKLLLEHGANPRTRDYMGKTAADWAHGEHRQEIRAILKAHR